MDTLPSSLRKHTERPRRSLFVAALCTWTCLSFGVAGASIAHAHNSAALSVSAVVVARCNVNTSPLDAALDLPSSLQVACSQNAPSALISAGARRSYSSATFSGDVMIATINF